MRTTLPHLTLLLLALLPTTAPATDLQYLPTADAHDSLASITPAGATLLHTPQFFPTEDPADLDRHAASLLTELDHTLAAARSDPAHVVRIHLYATTPAAADAARRAIRAHYPATRRPPVTCTLGQLPHPTAQLSLDATALAHADTPHTTPGLLPADRAKLYISGQAEKSPDPKDAARKTLASLNQTLTFLNSAPQHVAQAKCFLTPMSAAKDVEAEIRTALGPHVPVTFVEWKSAPDLPLEIELIAHAPTQPDAPAIEFLTPPGMTASPLFARATRLAPAAPTLHTASLQGDPATDAPTQITTLYATLKDLLTQSQTDLHHLAKATYYPTTDQASKSLNTLRPNYYDPKRPPAASKAMVPAIHPQTSISIDLIAAIPQ